MPYAIASRPVKMHAIVMAMLEAAMESAIEEAPEEAQATQVATQLANTMWLEMPHEWLAFVASILDFNNGKRAFVGAPPAIKNEHLLTVDSFFDNDAEAEKFLGRRAAYALHLFAQTCSGEERLVKHEYGLVLFHLQAHQDSLAKADRTLGTKADWVLFWSTLLQSVDEVIQEAPLQGLADATIIYSKMWGGSVRNRFGMMRTGPPQFSRPRDDGKHIAQNITPPNSPTGVYYQLSQLATCLQPSACGSPWCLAIQVVFLGALGVLTVEVDTMFDTSLWPGGSDQDLVAKKIEEIILQAKTSQLEHARNKGAEAAKAPTEEKVAAEAAAAEAAEAAEAAAAQAAEPEGLALAGVVGAWMFPKDPDPQL